MMAATVTPISTHLKKIELSTHLDRKTSNGSLDSCLPRGVNSSEFVSAFTSLRASIERRIFLTDGGSSASERVCSISPRLQTLTRSTRSCNDNRIISGVCCSESCLRVSQRIMQSKEEYPTSLSCRSLLNIWKHMPFCTRPARPRRCFALAREIKDSTSLESCRRSSNLNKY